MRLEKTGYYLMARDASLCIPLCWRMCHPIASFVLTDCCKGFPADTQRCVANKLHREETEAMSRYGVQRALAATLVFCLAALTALPSAAQIRATLKGHTLALASVDYSPDGHYLATGSYDSTPKIWDATSGSEVATLRGHHGTVEAVPFSPARQILATRPRAPT